MTAGATPRIALRFAVEDSSQVSPARSLAVQQARELGASEDVVDRVALVATELAENLHRHAFGGELLILPLGPGARAGISIVAVDRGPGVEHFEHCLVDGFTTGGTLGGGLGAAQRFATDFDAVSEPGRGTVVCAVLAFAHDRTIAPPLPFDVGAVGFPIPSESVNGDSCAVARSGSRIMAMVADGLGHGPDAARASSAATVTLKTLAHTGPGALLSEVNLRIASTRGAAVSVAGLDIDDVRHGGQLVSAGLGNVGMLIAAPDGSSRRVVTSHGTAGARQRVSIQEHRTPFPAHGTLVLHSDGLTSRWTLDGRSELLRHSALVVAAALWRDHQRGTDDSLVLVVKGRRPLVAS